ncbi:hypothetical protein ACFYZ5_46650 [Streptomyces chartreusis]|uniref:hypothetical protein n=1 Tax=Streptomyces chartreusis TaxID=1969 RepID=UPI0036C9310F
MGLLDPANALCEIVRSGRCPPRKTLSTTGRSPFTVVVDRADDVRFTRTAPAAHHPAAGWVVVHPTVGGSSRLLWHEILNAVADGRRPRAESSLVRRAR